MGIRQIIALTGLTVAIMFVLSVAWKFWLPEPFTVSFIARDGTELLNERWRFVFAVVGFSIIGLLLPTTLFIRSAMAERRKQREQELGEERYRALVELSPEAILIHQDGRVLYANPAAVGLLAADSLEDLTGRLLLDFIHPDYRERATSRLQALMDGAARVPLVAMKIVNMNGDVRDIEIMAGLTVYQGKPANHSVIRDITARKVAEARLRDAVENVADGFVLWDSDDRLVLMNGRFKQLFPDIAKTMKPGIRFEDSLRMFIRQGLVPVAGGDVETWTAERIEQHRNPDEPYELHLADQRCLLVSERRTGDGQTVSTFTDISERVRSQEQLRDSEKQLREILQISPIGVGITRLSDARLVFANTKLAKLFGYKLEELRGFNTIRFMADRKERREILRALSRDGHLLNQEVERTRQDGTSIWFQLSMELITFEGEQSVLWWAYDITGQKQIREQLAQLANYDMLTGLANRRLFQDHLRRTLARTRRRGGIGALLYVDLDGFKEVNDTLGHGFGDSLLAESGKRIQACVRESDLVSRMGGDEFTLIVEEMPDDSSAETVAEKVLLALSLPFIRDGKEASISASIGIAYFDGKRPDGDVLLREADRAMYRAKNEGRHTYRVFDPQADALDTERLV